MSGEHIAENLLQEWIDHWWARWDLGDLKAKLDDLEAKVNELDDKKVTVPLGWKIVTSENVDTLKNGGITSYASADGVYDKLDDEDDRDDFDWKTHQDQMARLELRRLRAEVIKAEIEAAEAIQNSDFYSFADGDVGVVAKDVKGYLEDWG
ncbi:MULTISPECIES: hypothetical protein [Agrobacterium]|uniref:hypothetical protein n=1 Tax=Agrobacterium TaxID=357 RepID=UPI001572079F|nr:MULTISPECIES: hypothetical protein [Agrobacterium]MCD4659430.1 hypothetical protein [Agrobacterium sp.]NTE54380.1 hypothetical protein [Agrobacterium tumefaciens]NTE70545.1 hypothetical protein [Agrobacterium tumefaciens]